jgi:5-formyltetrahydrofolate cyclo-ligase
MVRTLPDMAEGMRDTAGKSECRRHWLERRRSLPPEMRAAADEALCATIVNWEDYRKARTVGLYLHMREEADIDAVAEDAWGCGKRVAAPRVVEGPAGVMEMRAIRNWSEMTGAGGVLGLPEPAASTPSVAPADIDLWLVPGVAFTERGERLGYGGGYYDRLLTRTRSGAILAGIAYEQQIAPFLPGDPWDVPMTFVITPARLIDCRRTAGPSRS